MKRILLALFAAVLFLGLLAYPLSRKAFAQESEPEHEDQNQSDEQSSQAVSDDEPQEQEEPGTADSNDTQAGEDEQGAVKDEPSNEPEAEDSAASPDTEADTHESEQAADSNEAPDNQQEEQGTVEHEPSNEPEAEDSPASADTQADTDESGEAADSNETPDEQQEEQGAVEQEPSNEPAAADSPASTDTEANPEKPAEATTPSEGPPEENTATTEPASKETPATDAKPGENLTAEQIASLSEEEQITVGLLATAMQNIDKYKKYAEFVPDFNPDLLGAECRAREDVNPAEADDVCKMMVLQGAFAYQILQNGKNGNEIFQKLQAYMNKPACNSKEECKAYFDKEALNVGFNYGMKAAENGATQIEVPTAQSSPGGSQPLPDLGFTPEEQAEVDKRLDEYIKNNTDTRRQWNPYEFESNCMKQPKATEILCFGLTFTGMPLVTSLMGRKVTPEEIALQNEWVKTHPLPKKKIENLQQTFEEQLKDFAGAKPKQ